LINYIYILAIEESEGSIYTYFKSVSTRIRVNSHSKVRREAGGALTREPWRCHVASGSRKSPKFSEMGQLLSDWRCALPLEAVLAAARGRGGGCGRVWSSGHARAVAETAGCRLGSRRSRRRARLELRRRARAAAEGADRQGMSPPGRSLGRLVGRSVGSGRAFDFLWWCALSGVVCGGWGSGFPCPRILDFMGVPPLFASRLLSWTLYVRAC